MQNLGALIPPPPPQKKKRGTLILERLKDKLGTTLHEIQN